MNHLCKFENKIITLCEDVAETKADIKSLSKRINGSMDGIEDHILQGRKWRTTITSIAVLIIIQIMTFAYFFGSLNKTVSSNERFILEAFKNKSYTINKHITSLLPQKP